MSTKEELKTRVQELEDELSTQTSRLAAAYRSRDREHGRAAAANKHNGELQKALRIAIHEKKMLQLGIDADKYNIRRLKLVTDQLRMAREVLNTPTDDWIAQSADVPLDKLLR